MMLFINRNCYNSLQILGLYPSVFFFLKKRLLAPPVVLQNLARGQWSVRNKGNLLYYDSS